jgi:sulfite exporter TauE/SafE
METSQLIGIFLTGLLAGGLSCMAVQGGLLAATIAQRHEQELTNKAKSGLTQPILAFLLAKLIAYTALGFLLGWLGAALQFSFTIQILLQTVVGIFMLGTALHLLKVHPIFRYFVIQPPYFITKRIRKETKSKSFFAPALLGAFTVFIPCGTTQAIMALSVASGNPLTGAVILFAFVLGTSPIFFLLGYFTSQATLAAQTALTKFAAVILLSLAVFNLNNAVALTGSTATLDNFGRGAWCLLSICEDQFDSVPPQNDTAITIDSSGYFPKQFSVNAGEDVTLKLSNKDSNNCAQDFTIPQIGLKQIVPLGTSQTVRFKAPEEPGQLTFMCSMGMYRGVINVI